MNTQLWYTTRKQVQISSIDLCSHQRFDDYLARSYSAFDNCSSYISKLRLDFQTHHTRKSRRRTHLLSIP